MLQEYYDALENAGEEYTVAEEFESCDEYIGFRDGIRYNIWFSVYNDHHGIILISPMDLYGRGVSYAPEGLEEYDHVSYGVNTEEVGTNQCNMPREDARTLASQMLSACGQKSSELMEEGSLVWSGWNDSEDEDTEYKEITYGYSFVYGAGVDGLAFQESGNYTSYADFAGYDRLDEAFYDLQASVMVLVADEGMIGVSIMYPVTVNQITEKVELLPLSVIENIMKSEITDNFGQYSYEGWLRDNYKAFNSLELIYFRLRDRDRPGVYSYVPAWRLCWESENGYYEHPVLVNAIDGSVIYLEEEMGSGE